MSYFLYFLLGISAFLIPLFFIFGIGGAAHVLSNRKMSLFPPMVFAIGVGVALTNLLSGRDLTYVGLALDNLYTEPGVAGGLVNKLLTWAIFFTCVFGIFDRIWVRVLRGEKITDKIGWLAILVIFSLTNGPLSSIFGRHPEFTPGLLYPVAFLAFVIIDDRWDTENVIRFSRDACAFVIIAGLLVLPISPGLVLEQHVKGFLPLISFRYWGASSHANAIGPIAVLFLLLSYVRPYSRKSTTVFLNFLAISTLLLSQSKTSLGGAVAAAGGILVVKFLIWFRSRKSGSPIGLIEALVFFLVIAGCIYGVVFLLTFNFSSALARFFSSDVGYSVSTLSGRKQIWDVALQEWNASPIFGYGPGLFDADHRFLLKMNFAFHAHNQFMQSLAQGGVVGLFGLVLMLIVFAKKSIELSFSTRGVSLGLLFFIGVRCVTEVPFRSGSLLSGEFILFVCWFALLIRPINFVNTDTRNLSS